MLFLFSPHNKRKNRSKRFWSQPHHSLAWVAGVPSQGPASLSIHGVTAGPPCRAAQGVPAQLREPGRRLLHLCLVFPG